MPRARPWIASTALLAILAVVGLGALVSRGDNSFDAVWLDWMEELRTPVGVAAAVFFHHVGADWIGAWLLPGLMVAALLLWRRPWAAGFLVVAALAEVGLVRLLKLFFARDRPEHGILDAGFGSYPSGHAARAAMLAAVFALVFPRVWVLVTGVVYTVFMMLSRTYLGVHWLTDVVGGAVVGAAVALLVWILFARRLAAENVQHHPPPWHPAGHRGSV